jgi:hypothetical protein
VDGIHIVGGSVWLGELIDQYGEYLVADLTETYNIDLRDIFRDDKDLSPRWLMAHILNLPLGSRFYAEQQGGQQFRGWDESRYAQVATVNAIRALQYTYISAHSKRKPPMPDMFPIPEATVKVRKKKQGPGSFAYIAAQQLAQVKKVGD